MKYIDVKKQLIYGVTLTTVHNEIEYTAVGYGVTVYFALNVEKCWSAIILSGAKYGCIAGKSIKAMLQQMPVNNLPTCTALTKRITNAVLHFVGP